MGLTVDEMYTKNEQEKLKYIYQKKINNKELKDCNVEELITHNLGKYCVNNGAMATAQNALSVIKHLCSPCFDELGDQLQLKLVLNNDEQKI
jgi:hypothetical protein